ncbi:MAG TPA: biopolymer transporter ExbD [Vicinamibacterales bacterium]|nr:biopolymer transporter ExbD [Vicinamibacterales bacterium]
MRLRRPPRLLAGVIPTATMADIAFLLIIFFMVTTAYSLDRSQLELPETAEQQQAPKGAALVVIAPDDTFRFSAGEEDARPVDGIAGLAAAIRQVTAGNRLQPFTIKADRRVRYRTIDAVLEQLRQAGAENITLLSRGEDGQ